MSSGHIESRYQPAIVETVRIVNVNIDMWSVDVVSEYGNKRWFDIQVMSPYFHYVNGEGIYAMPEVGALAWLCKGSAGDRAESFIIGYQAPYDESVDGFRDGRMALNPGDIMMATRDENYLILRRGGVIQIGSTPICQTMYVPINNIIRHFCEKFEINAFGGELLWETWRREESSNEDVFTTLYLNVKEKADDPGHAARLSIGSHGDGNPLRLQLTMYPDGTEGAEFVADLQIDNEGNVTWDSRFNYTIVAAKNFSVATEEEDITLDSARDFYAKSAEATNLESGGDMIVASGGKSELTAAQGMTLDGQTIKIGAGAAAEKMVLGTQLQNCLKQICTAIKSLISAPGTAGGPLPNAAAVIAPAETSIQMIISQKTSVE